MFPASYQTTLPTLTLALAVYRCRWGIEQLFKDCKTGGYRLEATTVNATRFLALVLLIAIAYGLATMHGQWMKKLGCHPLRGFPDSTPATVRATQTTMDRALGR